MRFSDWLIPLRQPSRRNLRRDRQPGRQQRVAAVLETLEHRLMLSGVTSGDYQQVAAPWFATHESDDAVTTTGETQQWIVRLTDWMSQRTGDVAAAADLLACETDGFRVERGLGLPGQLLLSVDSAQADRVLETLSDHPFVAYIEEDVSAAGAATFPNEQTDSIQLYSRQYSLDNTGQSGGIVDADIDAPEAWDITTGSLETVIAVIDSGVDYTHSDLYLNLWINQAEIPPAIKPLLNDIDADGLITFRDLNDESNAAHVSDLNATGYIDASDLLDDPRWADGIDTDGNEFEDDLVGWDFLENDNEPFDEHRHGTHVAGIIGATGNNGVGITGVNWQTSLMPLRFLDENNKGDISDAVEAINYTTMMRMRDADPVNIRVSNNSWGSSGSFSPSLFDAVSGNRDADILLVAAAGNGDVLGDGVDNDTVPFFPASFGLENVISVAALNDRGELAAFSNYGIHSVDIAAPGDNILSLEPGEGFISRSGTSMATPHVTGVAALVFDVYPTATAGEVRKAILAGAETTSVLDVVGSRSLNAHGALTASTFAPVPELVPIADITSTGVTEVVVSVKYRGDNAVDLTSLEVRDIEVTRQGFSEALLTPFSATVNSIDDIDAAIYRILAPGGTWDASDNGSYMVFLREGEVRDVGNLYSVPRKLGQFEVAIVDPNVFFVDTTDDTLDVNPGDGLAEDSNGDTSLRSAVMEANSTGAASTIVVPDGIYTLTIAGQGEDAAATGDLDLASSGGMILIGGGAGSTVVDAQRLDRLFDVHEGVTAEIHGFTLQNGNADQGGGLKNTGTLTIGSSIVTTNTAETDGGGVYNEGLLTITDSSLENNRTSSRFFGKGGGGLAVVGSGEGTAGQTSITNTSFVSNTSSNAGGGIIVIDAQVMLTRATIVSNTAQHGDGGGLLLRINDSQASSTLVSATVTGNDAPNGSGGGVFVDTSVDLLLIRSSIIAENQAGGSTDLAGRFISDGTSLFGQMANTDLALRQLESGAADLDRIGTIQSPLTIDLGLLERVDGVVHTRSPLADGLAARSNVAGRAELALTSGLPIVYSTVELEPNNSRSQAMRLDDRGWSLQSDADISSSATVPHVTVTGTGDGTFDFYSFTVSQAGSTAVFDIDNGALAAGDVFNTELFLFDSSDSLLASSDDASVDTGSTSGEDARIEHTFAAAGYYTIAVGAFDSFCDGSIATPGTFSRARHFSVGSGPESVAVGDLNGDGDLDLAVANRSSNDVSILLGNGYGSFTLARSFSVGSSPRSVAVGDLNGDGDLDLAIANNNSNDVSVLLGDGHGSFGLATGFAVGLNPRSVAVGDFNGDGNQDLVAANDSSDNVSILLGDGHGSFVAASHFAAGEFSRFVSLGDFNGDGNQDLAVANAGSQDVSILIGDGEGSFASAVPLNVGSQFQSVSVGDFNGDGNDDLVVPNSNNVSVFLGDGEGSFAAATNFAVGNGPVLVFVADIDGDGSQDLAVANNASSDVSVLLGDGHGSFGPATEFLVGLNPRSVAVGDFNGDGDQDVAVANRNSDDVSILAGIALIAGHLEGATPSLNTRYILHASIEHHVLAETMFNAIPETTLVPISGTSSVGRYVFSANEGKELFVESSTYTVGVAGNDPFAVSTVDVTGDDVPDIVTANFNSNDVSVLPGNGDGTFDNSVKYPVGDGPLSIAIGDVNGDGVLDIATANFLSHDVSVLSGNGDGTFQAGLTYTVGYYPRAISFSDVTGDGVLDIVVANHGSDNVSILSGNGDGTFQSPVNYAVGDGPVSVSIRDVTGDGVLDVVTANMKSDNVSVLPGNGDGTFQGGSTYTAGDSPSALSFADLTGEGMVDIVVANWGSDNVSVLTGNADGTFQSPVNYAVGDGPFAVSVGDVTGDGVLDVVTALFGEPLNLDSGDISVLPGNGDGTFQSSIKYDVGDRPRSVSVVDVNGDGNADVIASTGSSDNVAVLLGNGEGALQAVWAFSDPESVSVGDVSGDGVPDIVTANRNSDDVSVLLGDGGGTFQTTVNYHVGDAPRDVLLVDLNKDSVVDIVTVNGLSDNASVLLGNGDGSFQSALNVTVGDSPFSVSSGDLNGDGNLDIVTANRDSNNVSVLTGNGDGTFATAVNYGAESGTTSVSVADVTEDGTLDIVAANQFSDSVSIFVGNGDGTFQAAQNYPAGDWPLSVSVADTDGDGTLDIVTANRTTDTVSVLRGVGDGTFPTVVQYPVGDFPSSLSVVDVSDDGVLDIVTANFNSDDVSVLVGNSDGTFQSSISYTMGDAPASVSVGDVTGDGVTDIVTANQYSDNLSILVGNGARLLTLPALEGGLESLPLRGTPIVFGEAFGETWWIARPGQVTEYSLWSHGESKGLRQRAQFPAGFTDQRSITLRASGSRLAIFSNDEFYEYDPETNEVTATRGADGRFQAATEKSVGDDPRSMSLTDVDADGVLDIVTANLASDNVSVLTGNADGTFQTAVNFSTGDGPFSVAVGDVTGDGVVDIVAANIFGDDVSVLLGDGDGGFQDTVNYSVGAGCSGWDGYYCRPLSVALSDVNSDGQMDIITANQNSDNVAVLLGNGDGTFQSGISYPAGDDPFAMSLGDVNADDIMDIVTANLYSKDMSVLLGNADGTFNAAMNYAVGDAPLSVSLGDVDRDGATDIVTVTFHNENVSVLLGNGDGTFEPPKNFKAGGAPRVGSSLLDVTGDGLLDIAIANLNSGNVSVLVGNGDGTFHNPVNYAVGDAPLSVSFGDVTGDGILDIVTANAASDNISVLVGQSSLINVLDLAGTTVVGNRTAVRVRQSGGMTFQPLTIHAVASVLGNLENPRDYEFVHLGVFKDKLLASVRLKDTTARPGELQVLLFDAPQFDEEGNVLPSIAENLAFNTSLRLTVSDDDALFVTDDQIILTAEVVGSGIGSELFSLDRQNGLRLVADVLPGTESSQSRDFVADGNNVYFTALASRVDNDTRQSGLRRELFVVNLSENSVREIRAGREAGGQLSLVGDSLFFSDRLTSESLPQLFSYDTGQDDVDPYGASIPTTGDVTGTVFLDRNSDGQRNIGEPGRSGVTLYVDANGNGQREAIEPFVISRLDDPATPEDESGQFEFLGLAAGTHELREVPADGFRQTAPLTILSDDDPVLTELATVTTSGDDPDLGLPSIVGGDVVYVNLADSMLVVRESDSDTDVPLVTQGSVIPDVDLAIASIGASHAQDGNSIVLTATLTDDRELVLVVDSSGRLELVAETGSPLTTVPPGGQPVSTTLTDIEDARNQGFDSLSIVESSVGFLAETADGRQGYFLGGATQARFAEFDHAQVLLDGNNESFVDRVVEDTGTVLTGSDLFLDKASLDAREGANTGWQITTRSGIEILPLTFFDRIIDVSISGLSAAFKASDAAGNEALYLSSADGDLTREVDTSTSIPAGSGQFTRFGSNRDDPVNPSVALDGENFLFIGGRDHATGSPPISVAIGDVNDDEFSDIVTTHSEHISVLIGNGDGTFQVAVEYGTGTDPESVALNDLDGDGDNDIVTANVESGDVSVLLGNGDGTFLVAVNYLVGDGPRDVAVGDVNGDGDSDIVTANRIGNNVSVLLGNGDGTFQAAEHQSTGEKPRSVAIGDSYGNGVVDIITASLDEDTISVLRRNGDGTFEVAVNYNVGDGPRSVTVGDMDGDGDSDIVTANKFSNDVSVLKGNGDGTFEAAVSYDAGSSPFSVDLGDVDGDGSIDIVTANRSSDDVSILIGNGDATFQDAVSHRMGDKPLSVVLGDVTNNGLNDIVTANAGTSNVSVFVATGNGAFRHSPAEFGLYAKINGAIQKVVDRNSDFGARQLSDLAISHQALSGNQFVFHVTFSDGTESIYHAELPADPFVEVTVQAGRGVDNVGFGASALPGTIQGVSFTDVNVNGIFDPGESRNTGRTVFLDENLNGLLDDSELKTLTDELGEFAFVDLAAEATYVVREVLPDSLAATTLRTLTEATLFLGAAGIIGADLGSVDQSALGESADGVVQGLVFTDTNANTLQDDATTEPGRADVTVFADENGDAVLNGGERSTVTASDGTFTLDQLTGIRQSIRVVLSPATEQTVPLGNLFTTSTLRTVDSPVQVVSGDFDGDGIDDIASTINQANEVRFFLNDGTGHFNFGDRVEVASGPGSIDVGKFFGPDGRAGLVVGHRTASSVKVLVPQQDGSFETLDLITPQDVQAGGVFEGLGHAPYFVTTGDFNGDQQDDIAVAAQNAAPDGGTVSVFLGNGDGTFTHEQTVTLPKDKADAPTAITAGRANPGTTIDLVVANLVTANVVILSNSGVAGSDRFEIEDQSLPVGGISPTSVQLGDLDNDGHNEIVTTNLLSNDVSIFTNNGDGTFETATQHSAGTGPAFAQLVDLDQNGSLDIAFSNSEASNRFGILRNRDDGTFLAAEISGLAAFQDGTLAFSLAIGQFDDNNNDGVIDDLDTPDVVVSNRSDESLTGAVGSLTVGLNQIVPGALRVDLPPGARSASGLNFGLRTLNLPPTVAEINDPMAIDEDDPEQTLTVEEITTGGETEPLQVTVSSDNTSLIDPTIVFDESSGTATLRYTPTENLSGTALLGVTVRDPGPNGTFDVDVTDSDDGLTTRQFTVTVNAVDDPPPAVDDLFNVVSGTGAADLDVLANDEAENPDADEVLSILFVHPAVNGTVDILAGRTLRYTPDADFVGTETLTYTLTDTRSIDQAQVTVNVFAVTSVSLEVGNDALEIDVVENMLRVRRNGVVDDTLGNVFSGSVDSITLTAGDGDNLIDLSGVTPGDFTLGTGVTISVDAGAGQDTIIGSGLPDMIEGGEGDDKINTGGGNDTASGGTGNDTLSGGGGEDALDGGEGNDLVRGQGGADTLSGGPGDDTLDGGPAYDHLRETADVDFTATDSSLTGLGTDTLINIQLVQLFGGSTANTIDASAFSGRAFLNGSGGNDTLSGGGWYDRIFGGSGRDLITGGSSVVDPGTGSYTYDVLRGQGGNYDTLIGGDGNDKLNGGAGHDSLVGGGGDDVLTGESGNDTLEGGEGTDRLYERGDVDLTLTDGSLGGGLGSNTVSGIETAYLKGGNGDNLFDATGFSGDVTLIGVGGADTLKGGSGNDMINGRAGDDLITGGDGDDTLKGMRDADTLNGGAGDDWLDGGTQDDRLSGWTGDDEMYGRSGNDTLVGGEGNDSLYGAADNDLLQGDDGKTDTLHERDDDRLDGGDGTDTVRGGGGADTMLDDASEIDANFAYWAEWVDAV